MSICKRFPDKFMKDLCHELEKHDKRITLSKDECACNENGFNSKSKDGYPIGFMELSRHFMRVDKKKSKRWSRWSNNMKKLTINKVIDSEVVNFPEEIKVYLMKRVEFDDWMYETTNMVRKEQELIESKKKMREVRRIKKESKKRDKKSNIKNDKNKEISPRKTSPKKKLVNSSYQSSSTNTSPMRGTTTYNSNGGFTVSYVPTMGGVGFGGVW